MKYYSDIHELIADVRNGLFDKMDLNNRNELVFYPIYIGMKNKVLDSKYSHGLYTLPFIRRRAIEKEIANYINWIKKVFTKQKCINIKKETMKDILDHSKEYEDAFSLFDTRSKKIYLDLLCLRLTGDFNYILSHYNPNPQYLSKKISWKARPRVIDAGGFVGDTLLSFLDAGIIPEEYYIYELEDNNIMKLKKSIKKAQDKGVNTVLRKKGVYSKQGRVFFIPDGDSSRIVEYETENKIDVVTLDADVKMIPDFIKMDIEGSEYEALIGAKDIIAKYGPALAICIYHLKDDFWKIPLLIKKLNPNYKRFWIEHYQLGYNETVLFVSI